MFSCPICYEPFVRPKLLMCGHTFCQKCLVAVVENTRNFDTLPCPECRTETSISHDGIRGLRENHGVQRTMDLLIQNNIPDDYAFEDQSSAEMCRHSFFKDRIECPHCQVEFCEGCLLRHKDMLRIELNWLFHDVR